MTQNTTPILFRTAGMKDWDAPGDWLLGWALSDDGQVLTVRCNVGKLKIARKSSSIMTARWTVNDVAYDTVIPQMRGDAQGVLVLEAWVD
jgi:hypothetical protein